MHAHNAALNNLGKQRVLFVEFFRLVEGDEELRGIVVSVGSGHPNETTAVEFEALMELSLWAASVASCDTSGFNGGIAVDLEWLSVYRFATCSSACRVTTLNNEP